MAILPDNGMSHISSSHSVEETLKRIQLFLQSKSLNIFALIDHSGEAAKVGLRMNPTKLLIFGSSKGDTPLMVAAPTIAIDLPLKALVWEDSGGKVWVSYNTPVYLKRRHQVPDDMIKNIEGIGAMLEKAIL